MISNNNFKVVNCYWPTLSRQKKCESDLRPLCLNAAM